MKEHESLIAHILCHSTDIYVAWMAQKLKTDLLAESWQRSGEKLYSNCSLYYHVYNINTIGMPLNSTFRSINDHSKWAVSRRYKDQWTCIGDLNRAAEQAWRSGGFICTQNEQIYQAFRHLITHYESCYSAPRELWPTIPPNQHSPCYTGSAGNVSHSEKPPCEFLDMLGHPLVSCRSRWCRWRAALVLWCGALRGCVLGPALLPWLLSPSPLGWGERDTAAPKHIPVNTLHEHPWAPWDVGNRNLSHELSSQDWAGSKG